MTPFAEIVNSRIFAAPLEVERYLMHCTTEVLIWALPRVPGGVTRYLHW